MDSLQQDWPQQESTDSLLDRRTECISESVPAAHISPARYEAPDVFEARFSSMGPMQHLLRQPVFTATQEPDQTLSSRQQLSAHGMFEDLFVSSMDPTRHSLRQLSTEMQEWDLTLSFSQQLPAHELAVDVRLLSSRLRRRSRQRTSNGRLRRTAGLQAARYHGLADAAKRR